MRVELEMLRNCVFKLLTARAACAYILSPSFKNDLSPDDHDSKLLGVCVISGLVTIA